MCIAQYQKYYISLKGLYNPHGVGCGREEEV